MLKRRNLLIFLGALALASFCYSLFKGSLISGIYQPDSLFSAILFHIRLPRTLGAFTTGGMLALSGALMQVLLRNPLADPYVLGVSGGTAVATLFLLLCGFSGIILITGAWIGGLLAILLVFTLAQGKNFENTQRVLLTGIAFASATSALISFILLVSPEKELRGMLFWLMGDLSGCQFSGVEILILLAGLLLSLFFAPQLNILIRGEKEARALGVNTHRLHIALYLLSSLLTAAAVTIAGCIGFVGLIVPHMIRMLGVQDYRFLLPGSVLLGGALLTFADTLARSIINPEQLPVGIMMTLIGIPVFLFLLQKNSA